MFFNRFYLPYCCASFLVGLTILQIGFENHFWYLLSFTPFLLRVNFLRKIIGIASVMFLLAFGVHYLQINKMENFYQFSGQEVQIKARIVAHEIRTGDRQRIDLDIIDSSNKFFKGKSLQATISRFPLLKNGLMIEGNCLLQKPEPFDGFRYDRYLASKGIYLRCEKLFFEILNEPVIWYQQPLFWSRLKIMESIKSIWPSPVNALVAGLILGTRESFTENTLNNFSRSGITHIIALSGFNITILIVFFEKLALHLLIPKRLRLILILASIFIFTIFVGAGASIMRAAIMGSLVFLSKYMARQASPLRLLIITAAVMTLFNPFILLYDLGFQLSYLATLGLLYLTSLFEKLLFFLPEQLAIKESATTTLAATIPTLPLTIMQFQTMSFVSPLANIMVLPLIPILMALGALTVILNWTIPILTKPLVILVDLGCQYLLAVSAWMAGFSWSVVELSMSFTVMIFVYASILFVMFLYARMAKK